MLLLKNSKNISVKIYLVLKIQQILLLKIQESRVKKAVLLLKNSKILC